MNSATVFTGSDGGTTMTLVSRIKPATGGGVAQEDERKILVQRGADGIVGSDEHDGVAVGR